MALLFQTPEILTEIISLSSGGTRAASARVCRLWSKIAIDEIGRRLDSVIPLLELLAPMRTNRNAEWSFARRIVKADWEHFESYAARVKSLQWGNEENFRHSSGPLSDSVIAQLLLLRPSHATLLPRLHNITWSAKSDKSMLQILAFLSNSISKFACNLAPGCSSQALSEVFEFIGRGSFSLKEMWLHHPFRISQIDDSLSNPLEGQTRLSVVAIHRFYGSEKVVSALSGLHTLKKVLIYEGPAPPDDEVIQWKFNPSCFQKLEALQFCTLLTDAAKAFETKMPPFLRGISLTVPPNSPTSNAHLHRCLTNLAVSCPRLCRLRLELFSARDVTTEQIRFDSLTPLLQCYELTDLYVTHNKPIILAEGIVTEIVEA
ncbi:hypothetical protein FRB94_006020 [Tulasnella sp. JGI-2019a]|nr:hypothetical protein FRB93_005928 [Tulasnella sp. JGI-2019a]KAG8999597.1 hypothetical protein FRB94_006020 [Tulasnella sp. JGI-2019a]KAG9028933.1 hypothetical protein FRB95_005885 [Tulasnella sp. JGI-2019a]